MPMRARAQACESRRLQMVRRGAWRLALAHWVGMLGGESIVVAWVRLEELVGSYHDRVNPGVQRRHVWFCHP
jgi:hypothetical protein